MHTYAEHDSTSIEERSPTRDRVEAEDAAESRWVEEAERIGRDGEWNFDLADSMPYLLTALRGWQDSGFVLHIKNNGSATAYGQSKHDAGDLFIEVSGQHYWAWINGHRVWVKPDGNCFFRAVWRVLQASGNPAAVARVFGGKIPASEEDAVRYFRREISRYALDHPELQPVLLPDDTPLEAWRRRPAASPQTYKTGLPGGSEETGADEFFDAEEVADWLLQTGAATDAAGGVGRTEANESGAAREETGRSCHADETAPASGFFSGSFANATAVGTRLGEAVAAGARTGGELLGALGSDDVLQAWSSILVSDVFVDASSDAAWMPQFTQDDGLDASDRAAGGGKPRTPTRVKWSTPLVEYRPIPRACQTEFQRVLFSAGSQVAGWLAYGELLQLGYWALAKVSPILSTVASIAVTIYNLVRALKERDLLGGLIQILLALPYQLLSPQSLLFAVADETKHYIDEMLDGVVPEWLTSRREDIYMCVGLVGLFSYGGYFVSRHALIPSAVQAYRPVSRFPPNGFVFSNNMTPPRTPLGRNVVGMIGMLRRAVQGYAVLRTIVDAALTADHLAGAGEEKPQAERTLRNSAEHRRRKWETRARFASAKTKAGRASLHAERGEPVGTEHASARPQSPTDSGQPAQPLAREPAHAPAPLTQPAAGREDAANTCARSPATKNGGYVAVATAMATGAAVVGQVAFSTAGEQVAAPVEHVALLVDDEMAIGATVGARSLVRKSPLVGGIVGATGAVSAGAYGLYRLIAWLMQADSARPASRDVAAAENATSAVPLNATSTTAASTGRTALVSTTGRSITSTLDMQTNATSRTETSVLTETTTDSATASMDLTTGGATKGGSGLTNTLPCVSPEPGEAIAEAWPPGLESDESVDDFIVTLTEADDDFLAMRSSIIPSDGGMSSELMDLVLDRFEQESVAYRSSRSRRSASVDASGPIAPRATGELTLWIQNNWPAREAFSPASDDPMRKVAPGV